MFFCDIDHFKKYNDREGHPAGDEVLRQFSKIVKEVSEKYDGLSCRYGGEEFVLSFENKSDLELQNIAEDFMKRIREHQFPHGEKQPLGLVSSSMGIASFSRDGKTFEEVLECADQALYLSKESGRNQYQFFKKKKNSTQVVG